VSEPQFVSGSRWIDRDYDRVAAQLRAPVDLLQRATASAAARAASVVASLRVDIAGVDVGVSLQLHTCDVHETSSAPSGSPQLRLELAWTSLRSPGFFPAMLAELSASPVDTGGVQLEFRGSYWPPFGRLGLVFDSALGHRIAEATIQHLLDDVVAQLRRELTEPSGA
jgi:hypothetical protein